MAVKRLIRVKEKAVSIGRLLLWMTDAVKNHLLIFIQSCISAIIRIKLYFFCVVTCQLVKKHTI